MEYIKVNQTGEWGKDYIEDIKGPGKYQIPIPNYSYEDDDDMTADPYTWINVTVTKVVKPPKARFMVIMGYDENGKSQAWRYNGAQNCFKRVFQDGPYGDEPHKSDSIEYFFIGSAECEDGKEVCKHFRSL